MNFLKFFIAFAGGWWRSSERWKAATLTAALVSLTAMQVAIAVALNFWNLRLFDALEQRAMDRFLALIGAFSLILAANIGVTVAHLQIKRRLQVSWRRWMTRQMLRGWMGGGRHYMVSFAPGRQDNPDARIAEDIRVATEYAVDIGHSGLYSTILLVSFINILWSISGTVPLSGIGLDGDLPGYLVWTALIYTVVGAWIALRLGRPLTRAANRRQASEADFRFSMARARSHGLAIALMRGEGDERRRFTRLFHRVVRAWDGQTKALRQFFYYLSSWPLVSQIFPILLAAPRYIAGTISLGVLMQSAQAFGQVVAALSWPIDNLAKAAEWRASAQRVGQLDEALNSLRQPGKAGRITLTQARTRELGFRHLALTDAAGTPVTGHLDLTLHPGERMMLTGDDAALGPLFHAIAGLWPWGSGRIMVPPSDEIRLMPEQPYIPQGILHDALCYPDSREAHGLVAIIGALDRAGLARLSDHLEENAAWEDTLSFGDQQRLAFARLMLQSPAWIVLYNAATGLDSAQERDMMDLIDASCPRAGVLIIGHRPALEDRMTRIVAVNGP
ncbi:ABC transporter ATP-binding protein/permease [Iodidimonas sp. SYSU 1G8]|uniref:ABC transporter ATP-binding protein/permease n=1 Tax=Iodidimonas sp. SYSU 1G8 TaxID=3133967 RepID=UPI0031FF3095